MMSSNVTMPPPMYIFPLLSIRAAMTPPTWQDASSLLHAGDDDEQR